MPHLIIEYSKPLETHINTQTLMKKGIQILVDSNQFTPSAIKSRAISFAEYSLHENYDHFIHVTIQILEGRTLDIRENITQTIFDQFKQLCPIPRLSLSVDLQEMSSHTYKK